MRPLFFGHVWLRFSTLREFGIRDWGITIKSWDYDGE